jgi:cyclic pyranopterin phosphate synthase
MLYFSVKIGAALDSVADELGRPLRDLRISVTDRCNFRCAYCMPAGIYGRDYEFLPKPQLLTFEEVERLARILVGLGVEKIRITGGEPLLRAELPKLLGRLAALEGLRDLTLTTNGYLLAQQARALRESGLRRITVSLDSLDDEVFKRLSGQRHKVNCVVQRGVNDGELVELARYFRGTGHILRFIEFMDVGTLNDWNLERVVTAREILERVDAEFPLVAAEPNYRGEVASRYLYEDGSGEIGIISSVSQPFCNGCTRLRLTTDGKLVTCLFAADGEDLRVPLRSGASDTELREIIGRVWSCRSDRYSEERSANTDIPGRDRSRSRIEMYQIGG